MPNLGRPIPEMAEVKTVALVVAGIAALALLAMPNASHSQVGREAEIESVYDIPRTVRYSFTLSNASSRLIKKAEFWTYAPVKQTATQKVVSLDASLPFTLTVDDLGNQVMEFTLENLPPYSSTVVTVTADLLLSKQPNGMRLTEDAWSAFVVPEARIESAHPRVAVLAEALREQEPLETARNAYAWVAENIRFAGYIPDDRGALYAIEKREGDCTEYASLLAALARANGIPARMVGGYVYRENAILKPRDYHNWTEVYFGGSWQLADAQKRVFMDQQADYIAMRIVVDDDGGAMGGAHRFAHGGEGLKARMN